MATLLKLDCLAAARDVVSSGGLWDEWGFSGTPAGFAAWLFLHRYEADPAELDDEISDYVLQVKRHESLGLCLDTECWLAVTHEQHEMRLMDAIGKAIGQVIETAQRTAAGRNAVRALKNLATSQSASLGSHSMGVACLKALVVVLDKLERAAMQLPKDRLWFFRVPYTRHDPLFLFGYRRLAESFRKFPPMRRRTPLACVAQCLSAALDQKAHVLAKAALAEAVMKRRIQRRSLPPTVFSAVRRRSLL